MFVTHVKHKEGAQWATLGILPMRAVLYSRFRVGKLLQCPHITYECTWVQRYQKGHPFSKVGHCLGEERESSWRGFGLFIAKLCCVPGSMSFVGEYALRDPRESGKWVAGHVNEVISRIPL